MSAGTYAEKTVGYLAASILLKNTDEQITLIVQSIRNDLQSPQVCVTCIVVSACGCLRPYLHYVRAGECA